MDFEIAAFQAAQAAYPNCEMRGCFYHFVKNMRKQLCQVPNATYQYRNDPAFATNCKCVVAIAFVPLHRIDEAMTALEQNLPQGCQFLLEWLEDHYVGKYEVEWHRSNSLFFCCLSFLYVFGVCVTLLSDEILE